MILNRFGRIKNQIDFGSRKHLKICHAEAMRGNPDALHALGLFYQNGTCLPVSLIEAYNYFQRAFHLGSLQSESYMAFIELKWIEEGYQDDFSLTPEFSFSIKTALHHALNSHENGYVDGSKVLFRILLKDNLKDHYTTPLRIYYKSYKEALLISAKEGDELACALVIYEVICLNNEEFILESKMETIEFYLGNGGDKSSLAHLVVAKFYGQFGRKHFDREKSLYHMRCSADLGNAEASYLLGRYLIGQNDDFNAESRIRFAIRLGYPEAIAFMGDWLRLRNEPVTEVIMWYREAIKHKFAPASVALANLYINDPMVRRHITKQEVNKNLEKFGKVRI